MGEQQQNRDDDERDDGSKRKSKQTRYNWEHGHARPRDEQLAKIAAMRTLRKGEAGDRLKQLVAAQGKRRAKA